MKALECATLRASYNGNTLASQARAVGSIPIARSNFPVVSPHRLMPVVCQSGFVNQQHQQKHEHSRAAIVQYGN